MFAPQNEINTRRLKIRAIAQRICDMEVSHAEDPSQFIPMHWKRCEQLENEDLKLIFVMKSVAEENGGAFSRVLESMLSILDTRRLPEALSTRGREKNA